MKLSEFKKKKNSEPLKKGTLCFLLRDNEVLLAMKKRGFGVGKWNGVGGKIKEDETIEQAATREALEEIGVELVDFKKEGQLDFYHVGGGGMQVHVFVCSNWKGEPTESEEMKPDWFNYDNIPYSDMWEDDTHWLPLLLDGKSFTGEFLFEDDKLLDMLIEILD